MNSFSKRPQLSVIIASYNSRKTIEDCLRSLESQATTNDFEIIVVDSSMDETAKLIEKRFPKLKLYRFSERKFAGGARNIGISVAKGNIIAFIDADCRAEENWCEEILRAHESPFSAIGGAIANANPESYVGWAAYFCEFSQWMPERQSRSMDDIAGANMSYKKKVFDKYGDFIEGTYCSDTELHWRIGRDGHRLRFVPSILISHHNIDSLRRFLRHEFYHGQCFALVRVRTMNFSRLRRLAYVVFSPLISVKLFLKVALNNIKNRIYLAQFLRASPLVMIGLIYWSLGEASEYARGR